MNQHKLNPEIIDAQIAKADADSDQINLTEPRAINVSFDRETLRIHIHFSNGSNFSFLTSEVEELANLSPEKLTEVALTSCGKGLRWETLDIDLSIQGLLLGIFGSKSWMKQLTKKESIISTLSSRSDRRVGSPDFGR